MQATNRIAMAILITAQFLSVTVYGSEQKFLLGLQPMFFSEEENYDTEALFVNLLPVIGELPLNKAMRLRISVYLNYAFEEGSAEFHHAGLGFALPIFQIHADEQKPSRGFFASPYISCSYSPPETDFIISAAGEFGYSFLASENWQISVFSQIGTTYLLDVGDNEPTRNNSHFGVYVNIGRWF